ncbi:MAG: DNA polymerase III subunit delta [Butyrivibrio sp.]|nr:DNA polymerase III subunit delta [Butyrivibrio sp.]
MAPKQTSDYPAKQKQINNDIKEGAFKPCYLIYGDEVYLRNQNKDKLRDAILPSGDTMNYSHFEGKDINPAEIIDMAETLPFFADRRLIMIENSGLFKSGCPELADYLKKPSETTCFVFVEADVDRRKDIFKAVQKTGLDISCDTQTEDVLKRWVVSLFAKEGKTISPRAQAVFIDRVGTDMANISNEVEKLICYCIDKDQITETDIDEVCANWLTNRIFEMTDSIVEKKQKHAIELYYDLLALKEPPVKILALITSQFNMILQVKDMVDNGENINTIMSAIKKPKFVANKYVGWCRRYKREEIKETLNLCIQNDQAIKTGKLDAFISVEMVIVKASA